MKVTGKIVDDLRHQPGPVDGIDRSNLVLTLEVQVIRHRLDDILAIVKYALDSNVVNVLIHQTEHLCLLKRAHTTVGRNHEDAHTFFAAHGIFGCAAGVAAGSAKNVEFFTAPRQLVLKQVAQQLHGHVFESQCRPIRQGLQVQACFKLPHGHDLGRTEDFLRVSLLANRLQVRCRNVVDVQRQHFKRQVGIRQTAPAVQHGGRDLWVMLWQVQAAIGGQTFEQDVTKFAWGFVATGGEVVHVRG